MKKSTILTLLLSITGLMNAQNVPISGGNNFSAALCENQVIYVWGANTSGQLGVDGTGTQIGANYRNTPAPIVIGNISNTQTPSMGTLPAISKISAGSGFHGLAVSCDKQVWAWGENTNGQLGRNSAGTGSTPANYVPSRVLSGAQDAARNNSSADPANIYLDNISSTSGGSLSSFAIEEGTGYVLAWGSNNWGQLGDGTTINRTSPVYVFKEGGTRLANIINISAGERSAYALDANGNVWSWGITNDGTFAALELGRTPSASIAGANSGTCAPRAGLVTIGDNSLDPGYTTCTTTPLSNISQIAAGLSHCLALDKNGNVWSFGADWAEGQLGRGNQAVYHLCANRVVAPGVVKTSGWVESDFLGSGTDGKAVSIAAGQASSAVVLSNGKVVTFGSRGLYSIGATATGTGVTITCPGAGDVIGSGTLGDNNSTCNLSTCANKATASTQSRTPVYVTGIPSGEKIIQISKGEAWYFAISNTGNIYTWGWNRRGELGLGDFVDRCQATAFSIPTCNFGEPCPKKPNLGSNLSVCPMGISQNLNAGVDASGTTSFKWYHTTNLASSKTLLSTTGNTYTATQLGYYIVEVSDSRSAVASECGPCAVQRDTILFSATISPYTSTGCFDNSTSKGMFAITNPINSKIKWYATPSSVVAINTADSLASITTTATQQAICGGQVGVYAEDISSYGGTIISTGTSAPSTNQIAVATGCTQASWDSQGSFDNLMIEVTKDLRLRSISIMINNSFPLTGTNNILIYTNNPTANFCNNCNPPKNTDGKSTTVLASIPFSPNYTSTGTYKVIAVPMNVTLTPGKYWIGSDLQQSQVGFNCNRPFQSASYLWQTPYTDSKGILRATTAYKQGNYSTSGAYFDIKYETGTGYPCTRIPVCATTTCVITESNDVQIEQTISLSPNPNKGSFTLTLPNNFVSASITVVDALGHEVYQRISSGNSMEFTLSHLRAGVYTLRVSDNKQVAVTRLIIE